MGKNSAWLFLLVLLLLPGIQATPVTLNFASVSGATITFDGAGHFSFPNPVGGFGFLIGSESGGASAVGLGGNLTAPAAGFTIGAITGTLATGESAPATGSGTFSITDATANVLSGTLTMLNINSSGATGSTNNFATVDISGITYSGSNPDLLAFLGTHNGIVTTTFQWGDATHDLFFLAGHSAFTSYSGSVTSTTVVPEPGFSGALSLGMGGLLLMVRRRRRSAK